MMNNEIAIRMVKIIANKQVILDKYTKHLTYQSSDRIVFNESSFNYDNILHELCHFLTAIPEERAQTNFGLIRYV